MEQIQRDQDLILIEKQVPDLTAKIQTVEITDELSSKFANDLALACKKNIDMLEKKRKFIVQPFNDQIKVINNEFKRITEPLQEGIDILKGKLLRWQQAILKVRQEEQDKKDTAAAGFLGADAPIETEAPKVKVQSGMGQSFMRKVWAWRIINEAEIPREYLLIDEKKINNLVKAHTQTVKGISSNDLKIAGIEVYQKEEVSLRG